MAPSNLSPPAGGAGRAHRLQPPPHHARLVGTALAYNRDFVAPGLSRACPTAYP